MSVLVHCPCTSHAQIRIEDPPFLDATYEHHPLANLYFCEDCDAVKCSRCVMEEVACFYCPNCLFEVPMASVRSERNRCARNCFLCPQCTNTLAVVASDPAGDLDPTQPASSVGEPPWYLLCSHCRWDSKEVALVFDKPTGLSGIFQKQEDSTPLLPSFEHVRDHLEPFARSGKAALQAAAALSARQPPPATSRFSSISSLTARSRFTAAARTVATFKDELPPYEAMVPRSHPARVRREQEAWQAMHDLRTLDDVARVDDRAGRPWDPPLFKRELRPSRVPLRSKTTKRCPECKHILSKPEAKVSSIKFRMKQIAPQYLPAIDIYRRPPVTPADVRTTTTGPGPIRFRQQSRSRTAAAAAIEEPLRPGRSYSFELSFVNPLFEPIHVRLALVTPQQGPDGARPFALKVSAAHFPIGEFVEQWEIDVDDDEVTAAAGGGKERAPAGVIERKQNRTTIVLDLAIDRDFTGPLQTHMLVKYVYSAEDASPGDDAKEAAGTDTIKSFSYWTLLQLGSVSRAQQMPPNPTARTEDVRTASS